MGARAERGGGVPDIRHRRAGGEPGVVEDIGDPQPERERVAGARAEDVLHGHPIRPSLNGGPGDPAHEAMDRVAQLRLVERDLVLGAIERVAAVPQPVRPGHQHLAAPGACHVVRSVAVQDLASVQDDRAEPAADLDDDHPVPARGDLVLLAAGRDAGGGCRRALAHRGHPDACPDGAPTAAPASSCGCRDTTAIASSPRTTATTAVAAYSVERLMPAASCSGPTPNAATP